MFQKLPVSGFKWVENISQFSEDFTKSYNEECDKAYFVNVQYPENLHDFHNDLKFLPKRMKIEKIKKLVSNLHDKKEYIIHIKTLKQELNQELVLKKNHEVSKFN